MSMLESEMRSKRNNTMFVRERLEGKLEGLTRSDFQTFRVDLTELKGAAGTGVINPRARSDSVGQ